MFKKFIIIILLSLLIVLITLQTSNVFEEDESPLRLEVLTDVEATITEELTLTGDWEMDDADLLNWKLSWTPTNESKSYDIYRSYTGEATDFELIAENTLEDYFYAKDFAINGEAYYYVTISGEAIQSNTVKADGLLDSDGDELTDTMEYWIGTDPFNPDTDGDGLPDGYEVYHTLTNPLEKDSDQNGVIDSLEDPDQDGLTNFKEYELSTDPLNADSDFDGWDDGYELERGTDPLNADTDGDGLIDSLEEEFGFDPLNPDTSANGILDGDEVVTYTTETEEIELDPYVNPSVTIESRAADVTSTTITNMEGTNWFLTDDIPGYLGAPFDFNTEIDFTEAEMTFVYDESIVTDDFRPEIFYYNEDEQRLDRLENQTHDADNRSVTVTVDHFGQYLLLNGVIWDEVWETEIRPPELGEEG